MTGLCKGGNEPPCSLKASKRANRYSTGVDPPIYNVMLTNRRYDKMDKRKGTIDRGTNVRGGDESCSIETEDTLTCQSKALTTGRQEEQAKISTGLARVLKQTFHEDHGRLETSLAKRQTQGWATRAPKVQKNLETGKGRRSQPQQLQVVCSFAAKATVRSGGSCR
ncbi:hypothetical protein ANN_26529 [Periplaneta americana]|uniref:Uncharacterized protein n=1 Tax=Periplaneta americana TaxID=6978 RepID=A0ABQ8RYH1_PERAM|nr:hypothetical protein ANN_26529 [Periplaneta americana]